jgi:hypothetical protein
LTPAALKHDPEKWPPVFGKIMRKRQAKAKFRINLKSFRFSALIAAVLATMRKDVE